MVVLMDTATKPTASTQAPLLALGTTIGSAVEASLMAMELILTAGILAREQIQATVAAIIRRIHAVLLLENPHRPS